MYRRLCCELCTADFWQPTKLLAGSQLHPIEEARALFAMFSVLEERLRETDCPAPEHRVTGAESIQEAGPKLYLVFRQLPWHFFECIDGAGMFCLQGFSSFVFMPIMTVVADGKK